MIKSLLQVAPTQRPSSQNILEMPIVLKHMNDSDLEFMQPSELLNTIKIPKNLIMLANQFPKPNYTEESISNVKENLPVIKNTSLNSNEYKNTSNSNIVSEVNPVKYIEQGIKYERKLLPKRRSKEKLHQPLPYDSKPENKYELPDLNPQVHQH